MKESELQDLTRKHLMKNGWLVNKIIQSSNNGWPDLEAYKKGETVFVEVKKPGEENNEPLQLFRQQQLRDMGFRVFIIICVADLNNLP